MDWLKCTPIRPIVFENNMMNTNGYTYSYTVVISPGDEYYFQHSCVNDNPYRTYIRNPMGNILINCLKYNFDQDWEEIKDV